VNTWGDCYQINWLWVLTLEVAPTEEFVILRINHPFGTKPFDPLKYRSSKNKVKSDGEIEADKSSISGKSLKRFRQVSRVIYRFIRSFHVKKLKIVYPAEDYIRAAQLQPVFQIFRSRGVSVHTSYTGDEGLRFEGYNRVSSLLYHGFKVFALNK
jgi:hypothetical protein